jgi:hypothetical protein
MARYEEYVVSQRYLYSAEQFYDSLEREGVNGNKWNSRIVKVTPSDFVADVELVAKRVLQSPTEYLFFDEVYVKQNEQFHQDLQKRLTEEQYLDLKHSVQEKVGAAFKACKLHPVERYFRAKDLR